MRAKDWDGYVDLVNMIIPWDRKMTNGANQRRKTEGRGLEMLASNSDPSFFF